MSQDPPNYYRLMLGLPAAVSVPDHYELLGVQQFEDDPERIHTAAINRNRQLLSWQNSQFHVDADRLMNEVVAAREVLLDPLRRSAYDGQFESQSAFAPLVPPIPIPPLAPIEATNFFRCPSCGIVRKSSKPLGGVTIRCPQCHARAQASEDGRRFTLEAESAAETVSTTKVDDTSQSGSPRPNPFAVRIADSNARFGQTLPSTIEIGHADVEKLQIPMGRHPVDPQIRQRVRGPSIGLIGVGAFGACFWTLGLFLKISESTISSSEPATYCVFGLMQCFVAFAGFQMKNLKNHHVALAGSVLAMLPCSGCCCMAGLPIGIWSLVILNNSDVKQAFR